MSRRRELARRLGALTEIADILGAMKSLALMETRTLLGFIACQERMVAGIEAALGEFLAWHPELIHPLAQMAAQEAGATPWPEVMPVPGDGHRPPATLAPSAALWVLVGSEQGFCGDFNARLAARVRDPEARRLVGRWLVVGQRLATRLGGDPRIVQRLPGATVADEVPAVLLRLTRELNRLLAAGEPAGGGLAGGEPAGGGLGVLYQEEATNDLRLRQLLPLAGPLIPPGASEPDPPSATAPLPPSATTSIPPIAIAPISLSPMTSIPLSGMASISPSAMTSSSRATPDPIRPWLPDRTPNPAFPPLMHLPPGELLDGLTRHYLYAVLNQVLYSSLTAENRQRQTHMEQALQRLEEKAEGLRRACNAQRQEEITEEIEIILLSADRLAGLP